MRSCKFYKFDNYYVVLLKKRVNIYSIFYKAGCVAVYSVNGLINGAGFGHKVSEAKKSLSLYLSLSLDYSLSLSLVQNRDYFNPFISFKLDFV